MKTNYFIKYLCCGLISLLGSLTAFSQCPTSITTSSPSITPATCPSNGAITVNSNAGANATYQITNGPAGGGWPTTSQSSNVFSSLPAGNYTIKITCTSGSVTANVSATIVNNYTPLTLTTAVTNVCTNYTPGGTITATGSGGSPTLRYAFLLSNNPLEPDANFTYSTANTFTAPTFGTYQVRVKDACNNFTTNTVVVAPTSPAPASISGYYQYDCTTAIYNTTITSTNGDEIDPTNSGYKIEAWYVPAGSACSVPATAPNQTIIVNDYPDLSLTIPISNQKIVYRVTSPCGQSSITCQDGLTQPVLTTEGFVRVGCTSSSNSSIDIVVYNGKEPITVTIQGYTAANTPVVGTNLSGTLTPFTPIFPNIPPAHHYTYTATDACGRTVSNTIYTPTSTETPSVTSIEAYPYCSNVVGAVSIEISVAGYIPAMNASTITLVNAATGNFVAYPYSYNSNENLILFHNIFPGTYNIVFTPTVGGTCPITTLPLTVPANIGVVEFELDGTATQLCGGAGTITADLTYTYSSTNSVEYELLNSSNTVIATNGTGVFSNLPPDTYTVRATLYFSDCGLSDLIATKTFVIYPSGTQPVVTKKVGINCDGAPATGIASLTLAGFGPFLVEMKKTTETTFTTVGTNVGNEFVATGLVANTTYDIRITDQCATTSTTQVSVQPLGNVALLSTTHPCVGFPYILSVEDIAGATYSWTFNGNPISTSREINFASYSTANNGTYVCTVTIGSCVTRTVTATLNSTLCGTILPIRLISFTAIKQNKTSFLQWATATEQNNKGFEIERSTNGLSWKNIGFVKSQATNGNSSTRLDYRFTDKTPVIGINYYRLKQTDFDGKYEYTPVRTVQFNLENSISLYPNPARENITISGLQGGETIEVYDATGRKLNSINNNTTVVTTISVNSLNEGVYYIKIIGADGSTGSYKFIKTK